MRKLTGLFVLSLVFFVTVPVLETFAQGVQTQSFEVQIDVGLDQDPETAFLIQCDGFKQLEEDTVELLSIPVAVLSIPTQTGTFKPSELLAIPQYGVKLIQTPSAGFADVAGTGFERVELIEDLNGDLEPEVVFYFSLTDVFASYDACMGSSALALEIEFFRPEGSWYFLSSDAVEPATLEVDEPETNAEPAVAMPFNVHQTFATTQSSQGDAIRFVAMGTGIESVRVEIFSLFGERIFDSGFVRNNALSWNRLTDDGRLVANGVYLYVITARGFNGQMVRSQVKKIAVVR